LAQQLAARQEGMLDNSVYNLIAQLAEESKSIWRIRNNYLKDSEGDAEAQEFWRSLEQDKQDHIRRLSELLARRVQS
jgi:hypothetical protein